MKEQIIKRCIMEAGDDAVGKNVCMQMTFHGYTEDEVKEAMTAAENFWNEVKQRMFGADDEMSHTYIPVVSFAGDTNDFFQKLQSDFEKIVQQTWLKKIETVWGIR